MIFYKKWGITALLCLFTVVAIAQTAELRGFVYNEENGEPIPLANVFLKGTTTGVTTDFNGFYALSKIKPGSYVLMATSIGFDSFKVDIKLQSGDVLTQNIYLKPADYELQEVEINEERTARQTEAKVSVIKVTPDKIKRIPTVGGTADLAQYFQILPGVVFSGDQGGQMYVRGGSPIQNKVILDGMTIYNPFHSIGLFSVFDVDIIRSVDVYTGGYPAEYGGRISAVMDIKTRDGNRKRTAGHVEAGPFASKVLLEGPLVKSNNNNVSSSIIFSARSSYLKKTAPVLYPYADSNGLPYLFNDFYSKWSVQTPKGSKLDVFGFSFNDNVNFKNTTNYKWNANGAGTKMMFLPPQSSTVVEAHFDWSDYRMVQTEQDAAPRSSSISGFEGGLDFSYYNGNNLFKYGAQFIGFSTDFQYTNSANRTVSQTAYTTELAGYMHFKYKSNRLILEPGLRLHYFASLSELSPEPRLMGKVLVTDRFRFKFASGLYAQNLLSARSDRDVVNLFYGFLSGPDDLPNTFRGQDVKTRLQKAGHLIGGFELDLGDNSYINVEGFYKRFRQLTNINRNKLFDNTDEYASVEDYYKSDYVVEKGDAYGGDITYEYEKNRLYIWLVYNLTWVVRQDEKITYHPHWDRRHNANFLVTYTMGKNKNSEASARWNFGSGFPFTQTQGFYEQLDFSNGANTDYINSNGNLGILYGNLNGGRLSSYHRLDLSYKWWKEFGKYKKLEITTSVTNAYNRKNVFYFDRVTHARVNQLPILPSLSVGFYF
ncbi:TonB-dependent receptor plug domain-containing protein [bacterium]|nr:TonB-dependent receptor plug domain-containing protein [bacterium]